MKKRYGAHLVCQQHKAILLCGEGGRTQADIVVLIPQLWQHKVCPHCGQPQCSHGYELRSSCDRQFPIATWPDQHRENAAAYDLQTGGRYKKAVRAAKGLLRSGLEEFASIPSVIPSVLVENLFARVPQGAYAEANGCPYDLVRCVLDALQMEFRYGRARQFQELSDKRPLFDPAQTWTYARVERCVRQMHALL
ncbi:hypothetical protein OV090_33715 [Nannocystis sp. RBIL2]|uniref:hypothetical protein n=1 Tax=Nannocystis sp. RBIL2 TaxID=2996788 RepID=UPI002270EC1E|nr:hypothetical protein [Nannocystis sp. RBIL2]MCY1069747.1 hypothetical protein [Nannocystis sp. RBIL2]